MTSEALIEPMATLLRLRQQVEVAIGCAESGAWVDDPTIRMDKSSFRVGDFVILDTRRMIPNPNWVTPPSL
jgi:hypothetical protein